MTTKEGKRREEKNSAIENIRAVKRTDSKVD
jgi:hypothetical protein